MMHAHFALALSLASALSARAHVAAFGPGMYCKNGLSTEFVDSNDVIIEPLYRMKKEEWWMHGDCKYFQPPDGEFLEFPAGGSTTVELANNKGFTTLAYNGTYVSDWTDGLEHPEFEDGSWPPDTCIGDPNLHTQNFSMAQGTAFAISYTSNIDEVTLDNLVVFTTLPRSPWKRLAAYEVPADMPECPPGGCICVWGWIPDGCGQPNMYMVPFRCKITGAKPDAPKLAKPQVPEWCQDEPHKCVKGAKQFMAWHQIEGNNIIFEGFAKEKGEIWRSPAYNMKMGFEPGAQNDIFEPKVIQTPTTSTSTPPPTHVPVTPVPSPQDPTPVPVPAPIPTSSTPAPVPAPTPAPAPPSQSVPQLPPVTTTTTTTTPAEETGIQPPSESVSVLPPIGSTTPGHSHAGHHRGHHRGHHQRPNPGHGYIQPGDGRGSGWGQGHSRGHGRGRGWSHGRWRDSQSKFKP